MQADNHNTSVCTCVRWFHKIFLAINTCVTTHCANNRSTLHQVDRESTVYVWIQRMKFVSSELNQSPETL